ncbi:MAG: hypothetical protein IPG61_18860 [bacterium]|nr:hypothetical protein [bacterium]
MKSNKLAIAILIVTGLTAASCAGPKEVRLAGNGDIPAAESPVKVGANENGNTTFELGQAPGTAAARRSRRHRLCRVAARQRFGRPLAEHGCAQG